MDAKGTAEKLKNLTAEQRARLILRLKKQSDEEQSQSIRKIPAGTPPPLSFAQLRLWFLNELAPGSPLYNMSGAVRLKGMLDVAALDQSLNEIVQRHETLRTSFATVENQPIQVITPRVALDVPITSVREPDRLLQLIKTEAERPFDLATPPLLRVALWQLDVDDHVLQITMHHIISDGASVGVFMRELGTLYEAFSEGRPSPLTQLPIQYADYAHWQRQRLQGELLEKELAYWKQQLSDAPPFLELPFESQRQAVPSFHGAQCSIDLPKPLTEAIKELSRRAGVTLFILLLTALKILLHRYTGQRDIVVATPVDNRNRKEVEGLIGLFLNMLVLRTTISGEQSFRETLARVRDVASSAYEHQELPFERLVEEINPNRDGSGNPLFQVMFVFQNDREQSLKLSGLSLDFLKLDTGTAKSDLTLFMSDTEHGFNATLEYNTDLFSSETMTTMLGHLKVLLEGIVTNSDRPIQDLPLLTEAEKHRIVIEWNETRGAEPIELCVHELIEQQVAKTPDAVAVRSGTSSLTYAELDRRATLLASALRRAGVHPESVIGVCLPRTPEMAVALLAVWKAGGAYLPLDPDHPSSRLSFMMRDARVRVLITDSRLATRLPVDEVTVIEIDSVSSDGHAEIHGGAQPENLAYVLYTSGSTGAPKGVMIHHRALVNYLSWAVEFYRVEEGTGAPVHSTIGFDLTVTSLFCPLLTGRTVVLIPETEGIDGLNNALTSANNFSLVKITPSHLEMLNQLLANTSFDGRVRVLVIGGEALSGEALSFWTTHAPQTRLINEYGPTETVVGCCTHEVETGETGAVPIGRPITNMKLHVLDSRLNPVPVRALGEIYIGGAGVGRGYLHRPELTAERFVPDPFSRGARLYRTGDLGRYLADGRIEYVGRMDQQVKVRGHRIELGEVEAALREHDGVKEAVVVHGEGQLVGYVVWRAASSEAELRAQLRQRLPDYMVPSVFVWLESLPLTPNGKVDRQALSAPGERVSSGEWAGPRTVEEELLCGIFSEVLELERVGRDENFFELGGHSLLATRVISQVRRVFAVELSLRELFEDPTVSGLATRVKQARTGAAAPPLVRHAGSNETPLSFAQQRLWFLDQLEPGSTAYNLALGVRLSGRLDRAALRRALGEVVRRHEVLRSSFPAPDGLAVQRVAADYELVVEEIELSELGERELERRAALEAATPFDLSTGPVLRVKLLVLEEAEHVLLVTMHHIVSDGWSLEVLVREFSHLYERYVSGAESELPELAVQYGDYALWQREWLRGEVLEQQLGYWRKQLAGATKLELPPDFSPSAAASRAAGSSTIELTEELTKKLKKVCRERDVTLFMLLTAAFQTVLGTYANREEVVTGTDIANRNRNEVEGLVGFFVNQLVIRTDLSGNPGFTELLLRVRDTMLEAYEHQDAPFEKVVEALTQGRKLDSSPLFSIKLVLQNAPQADLALPGLQIKIFNIDPKVAKFDLMLTLTEDSGKLNGVFEYRKDLFSETTIDLLKLQILQILQTIAIEPDVSLTILKDSLNTLKTSYRTTHQLELKRASANKLFSTTRKKTVLTQ